MISVNNVSKIRGKTEVLKAITLQIGPGEAVGIAGPNGAGKSTLAEIVTGTLRPDSGSVLVDGRNISSDHRAKALVTTVFQQSLFDSMVTPEQALIFHARMCGVKHPRGRIADAMSALRVDGYRRKKIFELSGGNQHKVELAKAFICDTPVYVFDEPTTGLDEESKQTVWNRIRALQARGAALLIISHDARELSELATRIYRLEGGVLRPFDQGRVGFVSELQVARVVIEFANWRNDLLPVLAELPGVASARVGKTAAADPAALLKRLRDQGMIPASGNIKIIQLDAADNLIERLGIDSSHAIRIPAQGPAKIELEMKDVDANLPSLLSWAAEHDLQTASVTIERIGREAEGEAEA